MPIQDYFSANVHFFRSPLETKMMQVLTVVDVKAIRSLLRRVEKKCRTLGGFVHGLVSLPLYRQQLPETIYQAEAGAKLRMRMIKSVLKSMECLTGNDVAPGPGLLNLPLMTMCWNIDNSDGWSRHIAGNCGFESR